MDGHRASYFIVPEATTKSKLLCCVRKQSGTHTICLTDADDVWSTDITEDTLSQFPFLKSAEDFIIKARSALDTGSSSSVLVQDTNAVLRLDCGFRDLSLTLPRLEGADAKKELKELLFRMAECLTKFDNNVRSQSVSPMKNHQQRRHPDFAPRAQRKTGPPVTLKKRLPGDSLINPGTKRKHEAMGVAFDDAEDD